MTLCSNILNSRRKVQRSNDIQSLLAFHLTNKTVAWQVLLNCEYQPHSNTERAADMICILFRIKVQKIIFVFINFSFNRKTIIYIEQRPSAKKTPFLWKNKSASWNIFFDCNKINVPFVFLGYLFYGIRDSSACLPSKISFGSTIWTKNWTKKMRILDTPLSEQIQ